MHDQTLDALRRGAAAEALSAARDTVAAQPNDPTSHRLLAAALRLSGDREGALTAIDAALGLAPDDANLHFERAGLLLQERQLDEAQAALARAVGLDPNQFPAYIVQAQLALGRGDLQEAERVVRTAARIAPDHPQVAAIEGMLALRRGDADRALSILSQAAERAPEEPTLRLALGSAYLAKGHFAFAEQAFRVLLETQPESVSLRGLIANLVHRQGRPAEAADELAPLLDGAASPGLQRLYGELELSAGRADRAVAPLRSALGAAPHDRRALDALIEAWRRLDDAEDARRTLDAALATHPQETNLWRARLLFEPFAGPEALAVVERWLEAAPDSIPALEARARIHDVAGETEESEAIAYQIVALEPGHAQAELRIIDLLLQRDPAAAIARVESLLARAGDPGVKLNLRQLLGRCFDLAGDRAAAAATWAELQAEVVAQRLPLPPLSGVDGELPALAPLPTGAPGVLLLWGAPGSLVERIVQALATAGVPVRADRYGPQPPQDPLQRYGTAQQLRDGTLDGAFLISQWRAALPSRGISGGPVFDWLLWWDNALLLAARPYLPEAVLMIALRDPRDMLLEWLAYGAPAPFALESPEAGARWLAATLEQVADLHEQDLFPHRLLKLDDIAWDPVGLANALAQSLQITLPGQAAQALGPQRFAPGHWRAFAEPLADAFALLTPVARRFGYPDT
ncbi:MAG TPA: tetratricopeptide repeat protein [Lysobacter sp.]